MHKISARGSTALERRAAWVLAARRRSVVGHQSTRQSPTQIATWLASWACHSPAREWLMPQWCRVRQ